ncbi:MAG TPA: hypothetical protein VN577_11470 [Terriglobales bacterium]|nr:hypothetical protein [Terriglobales bacterium]
MTTKETDFRGRIGLTYTLPRNVMTAIFACPSCNWPIVNSMFTERENRDELHDSVFELTCGQCKWNGATLGRDIVDCMIDDWTAYKVRN